MEDLNDYFKMDYPPFFTNIDWNENQSTNNSFIPMEFDQQKIPPSYQHQPFQRRRSSSVDLPINPLYSNTNRFMMGNNETTIHEEDPQLHPTIKVGSSAVSFYILILICSYLNILNNFRHLNFQQAIISISIIYL